MTLGPADGYGDREEEAVHVVPKTAFPPDLALEAAMTLHFEVRIEDVRAATLTEQSRGLPGRAGPEPPGH